MESLKNKVALVTGGSQGIGREIAEALAREECRVAVVCANHLGKAEEVAERIRKQGGIAFAERCDVSEEEEVRDLFRKLKEKEGGVDILVNNARLDPWKRKTEMSEGEWFDRVLGVNLKGAFLCSRELFEQAKEKKWGRIVNISSVRAFRPAEPDMIAYGISKAGMHVLTRTWAQNGAPYGITANTVAPGMVVTENIHLRLTPEKYQEESSAIPLGRGASCEEIADAVLFVLKNGYVTGETININGGMYYAP